MISTQDLTTVTSYFQIPPAKMPRISTPTDKPNFISINKFCEALEANAMSVPSAFTDLGHLALVVEDHEFTAANAGIAFTPPTNPGLSPQAPKATSTTRILRSNTSKENSPTDSDDSSISTTQALSVNPYVAAETIRAFQEELQEYRKYCATRTALKNLIINAVDDTYISKLKHAKTKYALVTPLELLEHLHKTYGTVDDHDKTENEERMKEAWCPPTPIEKLFTQLQEGQEFAQFGGESISDGQLVRWGYNNIKNTGLFDNACKKWRLLQASQKTWPDFMAFFTKANDDREKNSVTTGEAKYTANQVEGILQQEMAALMEQMEAFKAQQSKENVPPPTESANAATGLSASDIKSLIKEALQTNNTNNKDNWTRNDRGNKRTNTNNKKCLPAQAIVDGFPVTYCWSHGISRNLNHTSKTCQRRKEGHQEEATYDNRMKGSNTTLGDRK